MLLRGKFFKFCHSERSENLTAFSRMRFLVPRNDKTQIKIKFPDHPPKTYYQFVY